MILVAICCAMFLLTACIAPLRILMILLAICCAEFLLALPLCGLQILLMLVATIEVAISVYYLKGIAGSGIRKS